MNRFSSLLLGLTLLVATACSKEKDPEPEPSLEGRWLATHQHIIEYNANGSLYKDYVRTTSSTHVFKFTSTTLTEVFYNFPNGTPVPVDSTQTPYTRVGNTIQHDPSLNKIFSSYQLTELTKNTMSLEGEALGTDARRVHISLDFTRK